MYGDVDVRLHALLTSALGSDRLHATGEFTLAIFFN